MNWIKCRDKLPDLYVFVLVLADNQGTGEPKPISIARLDDDKNWEFCNKAPCMPNYGAWMDIEYPLDQDDITHWTKLPAVPKEETY